MKTRTVGLLLLFVSIAYSAASTADLRHLFLSPPDEAKPRGYWVWPHGNSDYSTIRRELAEFKAKGLGGVDIFDLGVRDRKNVIPPGPGFMSAEQVDGIAFALEEARQLGLKMGLIVSSSWNAGGTWTPPELAMMNLVASKVTVSGPTHVDRILPFPDIPESFSKSYGKYPLHVPKDDEGLPLYREEITVLAYPVNADGQLSDPTRGRVLDEHLDATGRLVCDLPAGEWVILRSVLVNFGQRLWVPSDNSQGLTMDHFSKEATRHHFQTIIDRLEQRVGPLRETALERLYLASYEANAGVAWTPGLEIAFHEQNGYAIQPFLPALYGTVVVDQETTERFLYDYRKTVSELFVNNLYREASRLCHEHGLLLCSESGGPGTPLHDVPTEDLRALGAVDVMRGEFWVDKSDSLDESGFEILQVVKQIASAAHIYGHPVVEMESFTSHLNWQEGPDIFKHLADRAFCEGMNRVVYHTMTHNLPEAGKPGWTYSAGSHMSTALTWWDLSEGLHSYLARCSALLQQGRFAADVAYYYGHAIPNFAKPKHLRPGLGFGYDYDDLNTEVLLEAKVDSEGRIVLPSGMRYSLLVLPDGDRRMDLAVLKKLRRLLRQGATILGPKPNTTYGLSGYPKQEREIQRIAEVMWGKQTEEQVAERQIGRGRLVTGKPEAEVLANLGITPDLQIHPIEAGSEIDFIHRRTDREEIYFLRNKSEEVLNLEITCRVPKDYAPEIWHPVNGRMTPLAVYRRTGNGTTIPLKLSPQGALFVVFLNHAPDRPHITKVKTGGQTVFPRDASITPMFTAIYEGDETVGIDAEPGTYELTFSSDRVITVSSIPAHDPLEISGPWEVRFPFGWQASPRQTFNRLESWTEREDPGTRSFSGTAVYAKQFELMDGVAVPGARIHLDLGEVREIARVYLNGYDVGISSFAPHILDVTDQIRIGENSLVIEVANTWLNRLITDDDLPEAERLTHTNLRNGPGGRTRWKDAQPLPSGLLGPVRLVFPTDLPLDE